MNIIQGLLLITPIFLLAAASPTPDLILVSQQTLKNGKKAGFVCALGIIFGTTLHIAFTVLGLVIIINQTPALVWLIKLLGGCFLVAFGLNSFVSKPSRNTENKQLSVKNPNHPKSFLVGFLGNIFNPIAPLFFLSLFTLILSPDLPLYAIVIYGVWMLLLDMLRFILIIKLLSIPQIYKKLQKWENKIEYLLGAILIAFGLILVLT